MRLPDQPGQTASSRPASTPKTFAWLKWLFLAVALVLLVLISTLGLGESLRRYLKEHWDEILRMQAERPWQVGVLFFLIYVCAVGLSIPIAVPLSLAAGALYGRWYGTVFVSFASTTGATLAFLASRYFFRDIVQRRFGDRLQAINRGVATDGSYYLLSLRLQPIVPFWLINLGMGLTPMRVGTYWVVSQIGMLPGTFIYVNVGAAAGELAEAKGLWPLLLSLALLGFVPLAIRLTFRWLKRRQSTGE
jgi:uncharacterized membrane protein YdjX (TVP38/TMEM64 family)